MSEVDALYRLLTQAPPRAAELVKRVALAGMPLPEVAALYGVDEARARVLVFRALLELRAGGPLPDGEEALQVTSLFSPAPSPGLGRELRALWDGLSTHRDALRERLAQSAADFITSPDRVRDEWVRRVAIVVVLALTLFFYLRERDKPPVLHKRPTTAPLTAP